MKLKASPSPIQGRRFFWLVQFFQGQEHSDKKNSLSVRKNIKPARKKTKRSLSFSSGLPEFPQTPVYDRYNSIFSYALAIKSNELIIKSLGMSTNL